MVYGIQRILSGLHSVFVAESNLMLRIPTSLHMLSYVMQPYPCVSWQFETEIPNIKMLMGSMEQAVIPK